MATEGYRRIQARLEVAAGDGGAGCVSIWKSAGKGKFQPADGGNGGRGGDVVVEACPRLALSGSLLCIAGYGSLLSPRLWCTRASLLVKCSKP